MAAGNGTRCRGTLCVGRLEDMWGLGACGMLTNQAVFASVLLYALVEDMWGSGACGMLECSSVCVSALSCNTCAGGKHVGLRCMWRTRVLGSVVTLCYVDVHFGQPGPRQQRLALLLTLLAYITGSH